MFSYLQNRNGRYHFRLRVPNDLLEVIPQRELVKSLKTSNLKTAKITALPYLQEVTKTFTLLRSNYISSDQATESLSKLFNSRPRATTTQATRTTQKTNLKLSKVITDFIKDKLPEWSEKTRMENRGVYRLLLDLLGDVSVDTLDRPRMKELKDNLLKLPPNAYKNYPGSTLHEVLKMEGIQGMSITSVNKHLTRLHSLMSYCIQEGYRSDNPVDGLRVKQKRRADEERKAYDREDLKRITENLPQDKETPERYWVPLIGMYSGMRLDEICQLYTEDVREVDGVWCFDVNDSNDKKVKNLSSKRLVPVHPHLVSLGLLDYVRGCKGERLWMNLKWCKVNGYSNSLGKWYQRYNRQHVTADPLKTFHSMRHTLADILKQLIVEKEVISELLGHTTDSITLGRYGKRYKPQVLLKAIQALNIEH